MRITFVLQTSGLSGGVRVVATYARVLKEQGHEVSVVSAAWPKHSKARRFWLWLTGRKQRIRHWQDSPLLESLGRCHNRYDPDKPFDPEVVPDGDAVFATWWRTADKVAALPASKGSKFYLLQDYEAFEFQPIDEVSATYNLPMTKIAVSSYIRDEISANHGPMQIEVVNNAVDMEQFRSVARDKSETMTVGFMYNFHPRKQIGLAIDAIKLAREQLPNLRVIVFGQLTPPPKLPLPEWCEFHRAPPQDMIPKLYQACDLWLFPSKKEGFGLPLLEAMACRTPVLATPAGAAPDLIDGKNGFLLPEDADADAMCAEILRFAQMGNKEWQGYSAAAYETAQRNDWQNASKKLIQVIEATIAKDI